MKAFTDNDLPLNLHFHEYFCKKMNIPIDFHSIECIITLIAMKKSSNT